MLCRRIPERSHVAVQPLPGGHLFRAESAQLRRVPARHVVGHWRRVVHSVSAGQGRAVGRVARVLDLRGQLDYAISRLARVHTVHLQLEERRVAPVLLLPFLVLRVRAAETATVRQCHQLYVQRVSDRRRLPRRQSDARDRGSAARLLL